MTTFHEGWLSCVQVRCLFNIEVRYFLPLCSSRFVLFRCLSLSTKYDPLTLFLLQCSLTSCDSLLHLSLYLCLIKPLSVFPLCCLFGGWAIGIYWKCLPSGYALCMSWQGMLSIYAINIHQRLQTVLF